MKFSTSRRDKEQSLRVCSPGSAIDGWKWEKIHTHITEARKSGHEIPRETARTLKIETDFDPISCERIEERPRVVFRLRGDTRYCIFVVDVLL